LIRFKRSFTDEVPRNRETDFAESGIAAFHGRARFTGPDFSSSTAVRSSRGETS
jgi:glutathione reductase (NADPH)